jgi:hypothetical protein
LVFNAAFSAGVGFGSLVLGFGFFSVFQLDIVFCFDDVKLQPLYARNNYFAVAFAKTNSCTHCH